MNVNAPQQSRAPEWVTVHQTPGTKLLVVYCGRCEGALRLTLPIPIRELAEVSRQFGARHAKCAPPDPKPDPRQRDLF